MGTLGIRHNGSKLRAEIRARATPAQSSTSTLSTTSGSPSSSSSRYEFVMYGITSATKFSRIAQLRCSKKVTPRFCYHGLLAISRQDNGT